MCPTGRTLRPMQVFLDKQEIIQGYLVDNYILDLNYHPIGLLLGRVVYNKHGRAIGKIIKGKLYKFSGICIASLGTVETGLPEQVVNGSLKEEGWKIFSDIESDHFITWIETSEEWSIFSLTDVLNSAGVPIERDLLVVAHLN